MQTVQEIKDLADSRIQEAILLHNNGFFDSSIYLAGYSIELILKAKTLFSVKFFRVIKCTE